MTDRLILVRHGEAEGGGAGRLRGRTDAPLTPTGRRQAAWVGAVLGPALGAGAARCFCSPLRRAVQTAAIALEGTGRATTPLDGLMEVDVGEWEGLTFAEAAERRPDEAARWATWDPAFAFPGGEDLAGFLRRVELVCDTLTQVEADTLVAFSHGGVIRSAVCRLLGLDSRQYLAFDVGPACVVTVRLFGASGVLAGVRNWDSGSEIEAGEEAVSDPAADGPGGDSREDPAS